MSCRYRITFHNGEIDEITHVLYVEYWIGVDTVSVDFVTKDDIYSYAANIIERVEVISND